MAFPVAVVVLVSCSSSPVANEQAPTTPATGDSVAGRFDYDQGIPLDMQEESVSEREDAVVHDISYAGSGDDRVSAFLVVPAGEGPFAGVVFMHWGGGSRASFLDEAVSLAPLGVVSLLVDAPFKQDAAYFTDVVVDLRRATDLLSKRPDVDATRLAYVGHSWGATFGAILADVDKRFQTYILMAGVPSFSEFWNMEDMIPLDGIDYIGQAAPASLFFQFAERDANVTEEMSMRFYQAGSEPKRIQGYDTTHSFWSEEALADRLEWLATELAPP